MSGEFIQGFKDNLGEIKDSRNYFDQVSNKLEKQKYDLQSHALTGRTVQEGKIDSLCTRTKAFLSKTFTRGKKGEEINNHEINHNVGLKGSEQNKMMQQEMQKLSLRYKQASEPKKQQQLVKKEESKLESIMKEIKRNKALLKAAKDLKTGKQPAQLSKELDELPGSVNYCL